MRDCWPVCADTFHDLGQIRPGFQSRTIPVFALWSFRYSAKISPTRMKCPHCEVQMLPDWHDIGRYHDCQDPWLLRSTSCPGCERLIIVMVDQSYGNYGPPEEDMTIVIWPRRTNLPRVPDEVPDEFSEDYIEAFMVLTISEKASAALSRRCLQHILREKASVKPSSLDQEITQVLDSKQLPAYLAESLDAVRNIGNFAAHPIKSKNTGEVIAVEPGEAEWCIDVIEGLFSFYFVQPAQMQEKRAALNAKLAEAGKPPLK